MEAEKSFKLLSRKEAALILSVTDQSLINWEKEGKIKPVKVAGRIVRYRAEDVIKLISEC